jgi:hypothetical protein
MHPPKYKIKSIYTLRLGKVIAAVCRGRIGRRDGVQNVPLLPILVAGALPFGSILIIVRTPFKKWRSKWFPVHLFLDLSEGYPQILLEAFVLDMQPC